jgi:Holliday junction DNA helicase RuvA
MLSRARPADIAAHLRGGDEKALARLPGIGKKSAARLVVELGERVPEPAPGAQRGAAPAGPLQEALAVLGAMGMPGVQAEAALNRAREADPEVTGNIEHWVRAALRAL